MLRPAFFPCLDKAEGPVIHSEKRGQDKMEPIIHLEKCIGCGACARDCLRSLFVVENGKSHMTEGICIQCGHCVAVCPMDAIRLDGAPEEEISPYDPAAFDIPADHLLNFMKFRRSIRQFQNKPVEEEKIAALLEAARYAPTGGNQQKTRYILLDRQKDEMVGLALKTLYEAADRIDTDPALRGLKRYQPKWRSLYPAWKEQGKDGLFFHASRVLLVVSCFPKGGTGRLDAGLASANVELLAHALGLGVCYIGFFNMAAALEPEIYQRLGIRKEEEVVSTMAIGYPAVKYHRTVNRNPAELTRL